MRSTSRPTVAVASTARLQRLSPWGTAATSFIVALVFGVVLVVASALLWFVLTKIGILTEIDSKITSVAGDDAFQLTDVLTLSKMVGVTTVIAALIVGLSPVVGLVFAGVYNASAMLTGGIKVRLASEIPAPDAPAAPAEDPTDY